MLESNIEDDVIDWAVDEMGGKAPKLVIANERGFPDRSLFLPGAQLLIPELKRPKRNKRSPNQIKWVRWLQALGFAADFCESLDDVKRLHERHYG